MKLAIKLPSLRQATITLGVSLIGLLSLYLLMKVFKIDLRDLLVDVAVVGKVSPISGYLSTMGILIWCTAAAISLFTAIFIFKKVTGRKFAFFLTGSLFTIELLLDDLFMFHDHMVKKFFGANEHIFFALYFIFAVMYVIVFRTEIFQTKFTVLFIALGFLGASISIDYLADTRIIQPSNFERFLEDGLKWFGIVWWCSYLVQTSNSSIQELVNNKGNPAEI